MSSQAKWINFAFPMISENVLHLVLPVGFVFICLVLCICSIVHAVNRGRENRPMAESWFSRPSETSYSSFGETITTSEDGRNHPNLQIRCPDGNLFVLTDANQRTFHPTNGVIELRIRKPQAQIQASNRNQERLLQYDLSRAQSRPPQPLFSRLQILFTSCGNPLR